VTLESTPALLFQYESACLHLSRTLFPKAQIQARSSGVPLQFGFAAAPRARPGLKTAFRSTSLEKPMPSHLVPEILDGSVHLVYRGWSSPREHMVSRLRGEQIYNWPGNLVSPRVSCTAVVMIINVNLIQDVLVLEQGFDLRRTGASHQA